MINYQIKKWTLYFIIHDNDSEGGGCQEVGALAAIVGVPSGKCLREREEKKRKEESRI